LIELAQDSGASDQEVITPTKIVIEAANAMSIFPLSSTPDTVGRGTMNIEN